MRFRVYGVAALFRNVSHRGEHSPIGFPYCKDRISLQTRQRRFIRNVAFAGRGKMSYNDSSNSEAKMKLWSVLAMLLIFVTSLAAQSSKDSADGHVAAAK